MENPHPSHDTEDRYFAAEDVEKRWRLAYKLAQEAREQERRELKRIHYNHCPRCGEMLHAGVRGTFRVSQCPEGHGAWLDPPELKRIKNAKPFSLALTDAALNLFKRRTFWGQGE